MSRSCNGAGVGGARSWPIRSGDRRRAGWTHRVPRTALAELCIAVSPPAETSRVRQRTRAAQPVEPSRVDGVIDAAGFEPDAVWRLRRPWRRRSGTQERPTVVVCRSAGPRGGSTGGSGQGGRCGHTQKASELDEAALRAVLCRSLRHGPLPWRTGCRLPLRGLVETPGGAVPGLGPPAGLSPRRRGASAPPRMSRAQRRLQRRA